VYSRLNPCTQSVCSECLAGPLIPCSKIDWGGCHGSGQSDRHRVVRNQLQDIVGRQEFPVIGLAQGLRKKRSGSRVSRTSHAGLVKHGIDSQCARSIPRQRPNAWPPQEELTEAAQRRGTARQVSIVPPPFSPNRRSGSCSNVCGRSIA
jgi:hypothetical protein